MSKVPKWRELADELARKIAEGEYAPGSQLPQVRELVREGRGSITTVHRALQTLEAEGLVRSARGRGTTVLDPANAAAGPLLTGAARLDRLRRTGRPLAPGEDYTNSRALLRSCADQEVAELLGIELYNEIVIRSRSFVRGGTINALALNYIHMRALIDLPELLDTAPMPKFRHILYAERTGRTVTAGPQMVVSRPISKNELNEFGINVPEDLPVSVAVLRTLYSDEQGPLELWDDILRPGKWHPTG
ncbi:GntR family transcriptional regulator [Streptomyces sp. BRA346]|uniref:GntR family transcriptional regulator n=1 Tax=Streptomyces sp. BRA346 TaxID=2878199 RepID=UPI004063EC21